MAYALQHNIGLGGAAVVGIYRNYQGSHPAWRDPRGRFGYNPAVECRPVTPEQVKSVMSRRGGLIGTPSQLNADVMAKLSPQEQARL